MEDTENLRVQFPITLYEDHVLFNLRNVEDEEKTMRVFVDTGSPGSASTNYRSLCFWPDKCNDNPKPPQHKLGKSWLGNTVERISELVGTELDVLLGINILSDYYFSFSYKNKSLTFCVQRPELGRDFEDSDVVPLLHASSIPQVSFFITEEGEGKGDLQAFIDTGAPISYISRSIASRFAPIKEAGKKKDFYPGFGHWETELYSIPVTIGGWAPIPARFGVLPELLETGMMSGNVKAIIGADLFHSYEEVGFDLANCRMFLKNQLFE